MNKIELIKAVARNLRDLIVDSVPASFSNTAGTVYFDVVKLVHPQTDQLKGYYHYIYSGAGAGEEHVMSGFLPANNRAVFHNVFTATPSVNSNFIITKNWDKSEYDNAIDRVLGNAKLKHLQESVATMQVVATQYEYPVPSGFEYINNLRLVPDGNTNYKSDDKANRITELPPRFWDIAPNALGSYMIKFDPRKINLDNVSAQWMNIEGQSAFAIASIDTATIPQTLEEYVVSGATMLMAAQRIGEDKEWSEKFRTYRNIYNDLEQYIYTNRYGRRVGQ